MNQRPYFRWYRLSSRLPQMALLALALGLWHCEGSIMLEGDPSMVGEHAQPSDPNSPTDGTPPSGSVLDPNGPDPRLPPKTRPDGIPIPGTDSCRPPPERLWQLTPQQLAITLHRFFPGITAQKLEARFALYAVMGAPYSADPRVMNGSPLFTSEVFNAVRSLAEAAKESLYEEEGACFEKEPLACKDVVLSEIAPRLWRRPLSSEEVQQYNDFFQEQMQTYDAQTSLTLTLRGILMAPDVLFRSERGVMDEATGVANLSPYEVASAISYSLTDGPPDDELWAAAEDGSILDPQTVEMQVRRMLSVQPTLEEVSLEDNRAVRQVRGLMRFFREWMDVDKIRLSQRPDLGNIEGRLLRWLDNEPMLFLRLALWEDDPLLKTILEADYSIFSNTLNDHYGYNARDSGVSVGDRHPTSDGRIGLLMQSGFLTSHHSATHRGLFVRERMLCQPLTAPPEVDNNLMGLEQELEEMESRNISPREVRERHMSDPNCNSCHMQMDPIGFPFDTFDDVGRVREDWDGFPIDTAGELVGTQTIDGPVDDPATLIRKLAGAPEVHDCFVRQLFTYVHGRAPGAEDTCYLDRMEQNFRASDGDIMELMVDMMTGEEMRQRTPLFDDPAATEGGQ